jgi:hypothetical protein
MELVRRHPVAASVSVCVVLTATLVTAAAVLPLQGNVDHAVGHLSLGGPVLLLLMCALLWWPRVGPEPAARLARGTLVTGLAMAGLGLITEAIGAFGYADDQTSQASDLTILHAVGVVVWPVAFMVSVAGAIMSGGVELAHQRGASSRLVAGSVILALVVIAAFIAGAFIFGY